MTPDHRKLIFVYNLVEFVPFHRSFWPHISYCCTSAIEQTDDCFHGIRFGFQ